MSSISLQVHQLSLEIPCSADPAILRIVDTSNYADNLSVKCPLLQITVPGFNYPVNIQDLEPGFSLVLRACDLGLQTQDCGTVSQKLPDGIYQIRYSVSPNDKIFVEYRYLKVTQFMNKINQMLCNLELAACEPSADIKQKLSDIRLIQSFVMAAKAHVEDCGDDAKGMELLLYAQKRLLKLDGVRC